MSMLKLTWSALGLLLFPLVTSNVYGQQKGSKAPVAVILDTDIGPDYDDVGAMALLHALADKGEARPLAVVASNKNELVVPVIDVLNTYYGRPKLPTGAPKGKGPSLGAPQKWPEMLVANYPHKIKSTSDAPDAVSVYRKVLSGQPDKSVVIITVGFLTNLANLLDSSPDQYSKLSGRDLVLKKVNHLVSMAGNFPAGREYNVFIDSVASGKAFSGWPTKIIFSGFEIGKEIKTGRKLLAAGNLVSPVKDVYAKAMPFSKQDRDGRMSWDQTAVLVGVRGADPYFDTSPGHFELQGGRNSWKSDANGPHRYLTKKMPTDQLTAIIEELMMHQRKQKK